jgi:hypothetical protein
MEKRGKTMKKVAAMIFVLVLVCSWAYAVEFSPPVLRYSIAPVIQYNFDGTTLKIPVTVSGSPAGTFFCVFTKDKAETIGEVRNGYLGYHYVNKIDTSIYISPFTPLGIGKNTIEWNGKDENGNIVPAGEYTYYLWGYDYQNQKLFVSKSVQSSSHNNCAMAHIQELDEKGNPLAKPWFFFNQYNTGYKGKWVIGNDPDDAGLLETCNIFWAENWNIERVVIPVPNDFSDIFCMIGLSTSIGNDRGVARFKWVPNGDATPVTTWGENGYAGIKEIWDQGSGPAADNTYVYYVNQSYHDNTGDVPLSELLYITIDEGTIEQRKDMSDWWCSVADKAGDGQLNGGPNGYMYRGGYLFLGSHSSCLVQMLDPNVDDYLEGVKWSNKNGDYVFDHHFLADDPKPWVCNDYKIPPFWTSFQGDANFFCIGPLYDLGATSFALVAPDGSTIGNFAFAGETASRKYFDNYCDYGSPYDGIYTDNTSSVSKEENPDQIPIAGLKWIGHDSVKGILTNRPVAVEEAPAVFAVSQNSPNPFNPTTTISFTIPEAGSVSVDVFNIAGQKVDTITNEFMNAGNHSVIWDASDFSAGVYFYTVKAGNYSKTMKMTLVK